MKTVKLGDICEFRRGLTYKKTDEVVTSKNVVLRANNINLNNFRLNLDELRHIKDAIEIPSNKYLEKDSILVCVASGSKSHLGKVAYIDQDYTYAFGGFMGLIIPKRNEINGKFLYKILTSQRFRDLIESLTAGANINNLKFKDIQDFEFELPSLEEQRRVVERLDAAFEKIDRAIELTEKNIQNTIDLRRQLIESEMSSLGGDLTDLGSFCSFENGDRGKNYPSKSKQITTGVPFINAGNLNRSMIKLSNMAYISEDTFSKLGGGKIRKNDILFCLRGSLGKFATVGNLDKGAIASSLVIIRPDPDRALVDYLLYYFEGSQCERMIAKFENGTAQPNLSAGSLKKFEIYLPNTTDQEKVVKRLNSLAICIDNAKLSYIRKLKYLNAFKQSLLTQAFSQDEVN